MAVWVGVAVEAATVCVLPVTKPPLTMAPCPVPWPSATIVAPSIALLNVLSAKPPMFRSYTSSNVTDWFWLTVTSPLKLVNVTEPVALNVWLPINSAVVPVAYSPFADVSR